MIHSRSYSTVNELAIELLMQLQNHLDHSSETNKEMTFPANESLVAITYQEAIFKCAWKLAQKNRDEEDIRLAMRYLGMISGGTGFENIHTQSKGEDDLLIEYTRMLRANKQEEEELKNTNKQIIDENKQLKLENQKLLDQLQRLEQKEKITNNVRFF